MTTRAKAVLFFIAWIAILLASNHFLVAHKVGDNNGKPVNKSITIHVSGSEIGYVAEEDTAFCVAPSVELSYTSNEDDSATIVCSVPN